MDHLPPGPSAVGRLVAMCVAAAGLLVGAVSCSSDDDGSGPSATVGTDPIPTTQAPASTTTTIEDLEAQVEAAYLEAELAYYEVATAPDPDDERLSDHRVGDNLAAVRSVMERLRGEGVKATFGPNGPPRVEVESLHVGADASSAQVTSCVLDDVVQVEAATGQVVDDSSSAIRLEVELARQDGVWVIVNSERLSREYGATC